MVSAPMIGGPLGHPKIYINLVSSVYSFHLSSLSITWMLTILSLPQDQSGSRSCGYVAEMLPVYVTSIGQDSLCCISIACQKEKAADYHLFLFFTSLSTVSCLPLCLPWGGGVNIFFIISIFGLACPNTPLNHAPSDLAQSRIEPLPKFLGCSYW